METVARRNLIAVICTCVLTLSVVLPVRAEGPAQSRSVSVTGDAEVRVVPDEVVLTLGVETWDKDLGFAKGQNDQRVKHVMLLASEYGIDPQYVQTEYVNIEPRYNFEYEKRDFIGYFVRKTVVVTLKDISRFEDFLTAALEGGVNYVHGVEFRTTELRKYRDQARSLAIKAAQEKAVALASELGEKLGRPTEIREDQMGWWSSYGSWWGQRWGGLAAQNVVQQVGEPPSGLEGAVAPGQISVQARVTVRFELQ
jgi:hypothetical protein